jgi:3-oxoacyl-[acyl-carrier-protein] synthase-3
MGFINAIQTVGSMIESGSIEYGLIVTGEITWEYIDKVDYIMNTPDITEQEVRDYFAGFTLGCGAVAMILTKADKNDNLPKIKSNYTMTDTFDGHNRLCTADHEKIVTDSSALTHFGVLLGQRSVDKIKSETDFDKKQIDHIIMHQVSDVQIKKFVSSIGLDVSKTINTLENFGNTASAAIPFTLAKAADDNKFQKGDRIILLGFGSGINFNMMEVIW